MESRAIQYAYWWGGMCVRSAHGADLVSTQRDGIRSGVRTSLSFLIDIARGHETLS